jgi:hypothetical protein
MAVYRSIHIVGVEVGNVTVPSNTADKLDVLKCTGGNGGVSVLTSTTGFDLNTMAALTTSSCTLNSTTTRLACKAGDVLYVTVAQAAASAGSGVVVTIRYTID